MSKLSVAYLRVSTATNQDGYGFDGQKLDIDEFADLGRFQLQKVFHGYGQVQKPSVQHLVKYWSSSSKRV